MHVLLQTNLFIINLNVFFLVLCLQKKKKKFYCVIIQNIDFNYFRFSIREHFFVLAVVSSFVWPSSFFGAWPFLSSFVWSSCFFGAWPFLSSFVGPSSFFFRSLLAVFYFFIFQLILSSFVGPPIYGAWPFLIFIFGALQFFRSLAHRACGRF